MHRRFPPNLGQLAKRPESPVTGACVLPGRMTKGRNEVGALRRRSRRLSVIHDVEEDRWKAQKPLVALQCSKKAGASSFPPSGALAPFGPDLIEVKIPPHERIGAPVLNLLPTRPITVLHLSDLHISDSELSSRPRGDGESGDRITNRLWQSLFAPVAGQAPFADAELCLVTGDLVSSSPNREVFEAVRDALDARFPADANGGWRVVPGNHDRKWLGNFFPNRKMFEEVFKDWNAPWWRPGYPLAVLPLDSNPLGTSPLKWAPELARGLVADVEMQRVQIALRNLQGRIRRYVRAQLDAEEPVAQRQIATRLLSAFRMTDLDSILTAGKAPLPEHCLETLAEALQAMVWARLVRCLILHHHPVGIADTENLGITHQDVYLALANSGEFLRFVRANGISLLCHGHKHMPHRVVLQVPGFPGHPNQQIAVVGAGSTTRPGQGLAATLNVIRIDRDGSIDVSLRRPGPSDSWQAFPDRLSMRSWPSIKDELHKAALENALIKAEQAAIEVEILSTGDAVATAQLREVSSLLDEGQGDIELPLSISCSTMVRPPEITVDAMGVGAYAGKPDVRTLSTQPDSWKGVVVVPIAGAKKVALTFNYRFVLYAAFAQNDWQLEMLYGKPDRAEKYGWFARLPIESRASIVIRTASRIGKYLPLYENAEGANDPRELGDLIVELSHDRDQITVIAKNPIWGSLYGVSWWPEEAALTARKPEDEAARKRLAADARALDQSSALRDRLCAILDGFVGTEPNAEMVLFSIDGSESPALLRPVAWSSSAVQGRNGVTVFRFGAGVAGRAAWLADEVTWSARAADKRDAWGADVYLTVGSSTPHAAVWAIPLPFGSERPVAVLSIGARREGKLSEIITESSEIDEATRDGYIQKLLGVVDSLCREF